MNRFRAHRGAEESCAPRTRETTAHSFTHVLRSEGVQSSGLTPGLLLPGAPDAGSEFGMLDDPLIRHFIVEYTASQQNRSAVLSHHYRFVNGAQDTGAIGATQTLQREIPHRPAPAGNAWQG